MMTPTTIPTPTPTPAAMSTVPTPSTSPAPALHAFRIHRPFDVQIVVIAASAEEARARYEAEIDTLDADVVVDAIPDDTRLGVTWADDAPKAEDVPAGGSVEPDEHSPEYPCIIATAAQWAAHVAQGGRTFAVLYDWDT